MMDPHSPLPASKPSRRQFLFALQDFLDVRKEPAVNFCELMNLLQTETGPEGVADEKDALGIRRGEFLLNKIPRKNIAISETLGADPPRFAVPSKTRATDFQRTQSLLQRFL